MTTPIPFMWDGEAMVPKKGFGKLCDREFVVGMCYRLVEEQERSAASHRFYFAMVNECWQNLSEEAAADFPNPDALRKFALIRTGYRDERTIVASSKAEAQRLAAFIKPMDEYALVVPLGANVTVYTAKTQNTKAMKKDEFEASKNAVLSYLAEMIGTTPDALAKNAGQSA